MDCEGSGWNRKDSVSTSKRVSNRPLPGPPVPASEAAGGHSSMRKLGTDLDSDQCPSPGSCPSLLNSLDPRFVCGRWGSRAGIENGAGGVRSSGTKQRWDRVEEVFWARLRMDCGGKLSSEVKRFGQPLLTASVAERNKFWKGQPLARWKRTQRAVWRTRAPILKSWARRVSICAERQGCGK